ncbi:hypothetical protein B296_00032012 [Ensete ventricosum]|uniref:Uncharacterized protein n=1 Tax=Ensete ventricosum TaxID=4639 RepID=A0A426WWJ6_ENSVE|nr:hypothetical protein B296_00032012 [Ensete ventricosum]
MTKAPCRGSRQQARPPTGMAGAYKGGACRPSVGALPTAKLQGVAPRPGLPPTRATAGRSDRAMWHRLPARSCLRAAAVAREVQG